MKLVFFILIVLLIATVGFWKTLGAILGAVLVIVLLIALAIAAAVVGGFILLARSIRE
jgi:hypothetical protein